MQESQIDTSTTERQLLYDIRTEARKTNELLSALVLNVTENNNSSSNLLSQLLEVLSPIAKGLVQKEVNTVKPKQIAKRGKTNATTK